MNYTELDIALTEVGDVKAVTTLNDCNDILDQTDWSTVFSQSIFDIKNEDNVGKPVKLVATISSLSDSQAIDMDPVTRVTIFSMKLMDRHNGEIHCLPIPYDKFKSTIKDFQQKHCFLVFCGTVVSNQSSYVFYLKEIETRISAEDLIQVKPDPKKVAAKIFKKHAQSQDGITKYIKKTLIKELGIKGLNSAKELDKSIDFMILQSFSEGLDRSNSMKLHSLVIGAPNVGKKLLTLIARILNPVSDEVASVDGKITPAGLIGTAHIKGSNFISKPGYLPRISSGVLCIQDFHNIKRKRNEVLSTFSEVMESGVAIDSTSARTRHEAVTSIHLDMNRYSQVNKGQEYDVYSDIDIPTNIISRFDFIMDIPPDLTRQFQVAYDITKGSKVISSFNRSILEEEWQRILKRIVAYVRSNFFKVEISSDINKYITGKIRQIKKENKENASKSTALAGSITRIAISIQKHIKAIASARLSLKAKKEDVDLAFDFISEKLSFLSTLEDLKVPDFKKGQKPGPDERAKLLIDNFKGKEITVDEAKIFIKDKTEYEFTEKTIKRDLVKIGKPVKAKTFIIS
jgi:ribosome-associated translation inhibitor RaiA